MIDLTYTTADQWPGLLIGVAGPLHSDFDFDQLARGLRGG